MIGRGGFTVGLFLATGCAVMTHSRSGTLPTCRSANNCGPSRERDSLDFGAAWAGMATRTPGCHASPAESFVGPTVVSDFTDGLSSDGRGRYAKGTDGVLGSSVDIAAGLRIISPRKLTIDLSHPVPNGGGVSLGLVTVAADKLPYWVGLHTQWRTVNNRPQSLHDIPVGQTVTALQSNVYLYIDGRYQLLQMGDRSVGRLFDVHNTVAHAVDRGLYFVHLHYEVGQ